VILDSSAVIAVIEREPGHERLREAIGRAPEAGIGAPTLTEAGIVLGKRHGAERGRALLDRFRGEMGVTVIPFDDRHHEVADEAHARFGKGCHPAGLNYGDCMAYATARLAACPLLFVGDDFARTDLRAALETSLPANREAFGGP
jgi:ribonuclease VapC